MSRIYEGQGRTVSVSGGSLEQSYLERSGLHEVTGARCGFLIKIDGKTLDCRATQRKIQFTFNGETKEMTYAEFFTRLGFKE